jgi:hypothetical protein
MPAQDFGTALERCRGPVSHFDLASRMLLQPGFTLPSVSHPTVLAQHLVDIEAGQPWPFTRSDLIPFTLAVLACLPHCSIGADAALRLSGAVYLFEL